MSSLSTSKSEAMVLSQQMVDFSLRLGGELLSLLEVFKYLEFLLTSERKTEREVGGRPTVQRQQQFNRCGKDAAVPQGKAFELPVDPRSDRHLWS